MLVRAPELTELRAFCAAVDLGSIGRAARLLHISQPALSKRLQALEAVAGAKLLERSTRGVTVTAAGQRLYDAARRLLASADSVEALMRGLAVQTAPVRVATSPTVAHCWLPPAMVAFWAQSERRIAVELITANSGYVRTLVREGRCDLGLAAIDPDDDAPALSEIAIWADEVVIAAPEAHRWAGLAEIDPAEFAATAIIRRDPGANASRVVDAALARAGLEAVTPLAEFGSDLAARAASLAEGVPVLLPLAVLARGGAGGFVVRRVAGIRFTRQFALLLGGTLHDLSAPARAFAQHLLAWHAA